MAPKKPKPVPPPAVTAPGGRATSINPLTGENAATFPALPHADSPTLVTDPPVMVDPVLSAAVSMETPAGEVRVGTLCHVDGTAVATELKLCPTCGTEVTHG